MGANQKRHCWLREDFDCLMAPVSSAWEWAAKVGRCPDKRSAGAALTYPKTTEGALRELRLRGLKCDAVTLLGLVERGVVRPAGEPPDLQWTKDDIDTAAEWLYEKGHWDSWTHFCWVCNLRFGQCVKAYRVAAARFGWGFSLSFDLLGCVSVIDPPEEPDGYAFIRFFPTETKVAPVGEG
jgi:hypothetical protein